MKKLQSNESVNSSAPKLSRRGERYLVFAQPEEDQDGLVKRFQLDPARVYYQVREGRVRWLGGQGAGVLSATRRYCEAIGHR